MSEDIKLRALLGGCVLLFVSVIFSIVEFRYLIFGRVIDARIVQLDQVTLRGRHGSTSDHLRVKYAIPDGGPRDRLETDTVSLSWEDRLTGQTVPVQYIPGTDSSRLAGNDKFFFVYVTGAFVLATLAFGVWFWRDYSRASKWTPGGRTVTSPRR